MRNLPLICGLLIVNVVYAQNSLLVGKPVKVATNFKFAEGPAANSSGEVYFTDIPTNRIYRLDHSDSLVIVYEGTGGGNGLYFDKEDRLYVCEGDTKKISQLKKDNQLKPIAEGYNNGKFNRPNDLCIDIKGGIYFTDPAYYIKKSELGQETEAIYYISPDGKVSRIIDDLTRPNGIAINNEGTKLFVVEDADSRTWKYDIKQNGSVANKKLFCFVGDDGLTLDRHDRVYICNKYLSTIDVFSLEGKFIRSIDIPETPANIVFGGKEFNYLYVTALTSVYKIETNTRGR
jgi:gluconolactonase